MKLPLPVHSIRGFLNVTTPIEEPRPGRESTIGVRLPGDIESSASNPLINNPQQAARLLRESADPQIVKLAREALQTYQIAAGQRVMAPPPPPDGTRPIGVYTDHGIPATDPQRMIDMWKRAKPIKK